VPGQGYLALVDIDNAANEETARLVKEAGGEARSRCGETSTRKTTSSPRWTAPSSITASSIVPSTMSARTKRLDHLRIRIGPYLTDERNQHFLCMRNQIPIMLQAGGGIVVNTSSGAGVIGIKGTAACATAKHAVIGSSKPG
jgi:hypothetical protein